MIDGAGAHNYSYDPLDRLTAATHPNQSNESYTYDDVGNRTASHQGSSYTYQAFNRLVAANGASFGYDANGNLTSKTDASGSWTYRPASHGNLRARVCLERPANFDYFSPNQYLNKLVSKLTSSSGIGVE